MNKVIGLVLIAVGIVLLILGITQADSVASSWSKFFTGNPTDKAIWYMIGGVVGIVAGGALTAMSMRQLKNG
ncbi:hypothetical protein BH11PLA1_BH11PLA1_14230 [soil metagenome]